MVLNYYRNVAVTNSNISKVLSTLSCKKALLRWWNQNRTHYTAFYFSSTSFFSLAVLYLRTPNVREYEENMCKNTNADEFLCWNVQKLTITIKKYKARIYEKRTRYSLEIALPKKRIVVSQSTRQASNNLSQKLRRN